MRALSFCSTVRRIVRAGVFGVLLGGMALALGAGPFRLAPERPTLDRWNYPFNFQPADRPVAPTYGSFDSRFDTRDAEFLLGWDTATMLATNAGPGRYLLSRVRVTLTSVAPILPNKPFVYDPTYDSYRTYLKSGAEALPDSDPGRPIELYGVDFRGGFTVETFLEGSHFGPLGAYTSNTISIATRNAFGAMHDTNGVLIDIANNVGQLNAGWTNPPFEVRPWAVGTTTNVAPGGEMPDRATMSFDVDLSDPLVVGYLQTALDGGRLRFMVSSLSPAGQSTPGGTGTGGAGEYPWWANKENLLYDGPRLEIEGVLVGEEDVDRDLLPDDWERFWFDHLDSGADSDPDGDGATNLAELGAGTNPALAASVFRVAGWDRTPDGIDVLRFPVAASRRYVVETSPDLAAWSELPGRLTHPQPGMAQWIGERSEITGPGGARFLRVRVR